MTYATSEDYEGSFVFSRNVELEDGGKCVRCHSDRDIDLLSNLIQYTDTVLSERSPYYCVTIRKMEDRKASALLIGLNAKCFSIKPLWVVNQSIYYHTQNGGVFNGGPGVQTDQTCRPGDVIGCYIEHVRAERSLVNFIRNGRLIFRQWVNLPHDQLYPTIGFKNGPVELRVEWPSPQLDIKIPQDDLSQWIGFSGVTHDQFESTFTLLEYDKNCIAYSKQAPRPLTRENEYFEMELVLVHNERASSGIGLTPALAARFTMPGWDAPSIGYHADDGAIFHGSGNNPDVKNDGLCGRQGDRLGCGLVYPKEHVNEITERSQQDVVVYFSRNGRIIFHKCIMMPEGGFYPVVGMVTRGDVIRLDMNCKPPTILPHELEKWVSSRNQSAFRLYLTIELLDQKGRKLRLRNNERKKSLAQYMQQPINRECNYFSVKIVETGTKGRACIGVATTKFPESGKRLGTEHCSCAYDSHGGGILGAADTPSYGKPCRPGDVIGCFVDYIGASHAVVIFLLNGSVIGKNVLNKTEFDKIYASVTMEDGPVEIEADWPGMSAENGEVPQIDMNFTSCWLRPSVLISETVKQLRLQLKHGANMYESAQSPFPFTRSGATYFEIYPVDSQNELPAIGLTPVITHLNKKLGTMQGSIGYYCKESAVISSGAKLSLDGTVYTHGERIGCGVIFCDNADAEGRKPQTAIVYFTKARQIVFHTPVVQPFAGLLPTVCFGVEGSAAGFDLKVSPPLFPTALLREWLDDLKNRGFTIAKHNNYMSEAVVDHYSANPNGLEETNIKRNIYICYVEQDVEKALKIYEKLSSYGYPVETSFNNSSLDMVTSKLVSSEVVIACLSKSFSKSDIAFQEFSIMRSIEKAFVPIVVEQMRYPPLNKFKVFEDEFDFAEKFKIDFTGPDLDASIIIKEIKKAYAAQFCSGSSTSSCSLPSLGSEGEFDDTGVTGKKSNEKSRSSTCVLI